MNNQERDEFIKHDKEKRKEIIKNVVLLGLTNKELCCNPEKTQKHYIENYHKYSGNMLTQEKYKASDFWFNDAGLQFKWRNFENIIQIECISWNNVLKLIKQL